MLVSDGGWVLEGWSALFMRQEVFLVIETLFELCVVIGALVRSSTVTLHLTGRFQAEDGILKADEQELEEIR